MPEDSSQTESRAFDPATFETLRKKLTEFGASCGEREQPMVAAFVHMLSDPVERIRLHAPDAARFTDEEEECLREMEQRRE